MKNDIKHSLFVTILFLVSQPTIAQDKYEQAYSLPIKIERFAEFEEPNGQLIIGKIFPLGWSKSGNFASIIEPPDEACGCYLFKLIIQNLKTDEILWSFYYNEEEFRDEYDEAPNNYDELIQLKRVLFDEKLAEFGIIPSTSKKKLFPISTKEESLDVLMSFDLENNRFGNNDIFIKKACIEIVSNKRKTGKIILEKTYPYEDVLSLEKGGYLRSPFEERIAIVLVKISRGWEGLPRILQYEVIGAHLKSGFRQ